MNKHLLIEKIGFACCCVALTVLLALEIINK